MSLEDLPARSARLDPLSAASTPTGPVPGFRFHCPRQAVSRRYLRFPTSLTASFFAAEANEVAVTSRVTDEPRVAVDLTVTLAVMRNAAPGAREDVRYDPSVAGLELTRRGQ